MNDYKNRMKEWLRDFVREELLEDEEWWNKMSADQQADYIKQHPQSQKAQDAKKEKEDGGKKGGSIEVTGNTKAQEIEDWYDNNKDKITDEADREELSDMIRGLSVTEYDLEVANDEGDPYEEAEYLQNQIEDYKDDIKGLISKYDTKPKTQSQPKQKVAGAADSREVRNNVMNRLGRDQFNKMSYGELQQAYDDEFERLGWKKDGKSWVKQESVEETKKRDYKAEYKKFQSSTKAKKYRAELNKYNRQKGTYGNGDGKDASHKGGKIVGFEAQSKNRGRAEKSRLKKEAVLTENPIVASTVMHMSKLELTNPKTGKKIKATTPLVKKKHPLHKKAKLLFSKLFKKKKASVSQNQSQSDIDFYKKQFTGESINEEMYFDPKSKFKKYIDKVFKQAGIKVIKYDRMKQSFHNGAWGGFYTVKSDNKVDMPGQGKVKRGSAVVPVYISRKGEIELGIRAGGFHIGKVGSSRVVKNLKDFKEGDLTEVMMENKEKIKKYLMSKGDNEKDATDKLRFYDLVKKLYKGASPAKRAEIMSSLWANESVNEDVYAIVDKFNQKKQDYDQVYFKDNNLNKVKKHMKKMGKKYGKMNLIRVKTNGKMSLVEAVSKSQAQEIMRQLGGRKFEMLMGVKSKGVGKDGLILHIGKNPKKVSHIIIDLSRDEYNLTFGKIVKYQFKVVKKLKGVGVEQLHDMIEKYTGLFTTFRARK